MESQIQLFWINRVCRYFMLVASFSEHQVNVIYLFYFILCLIMIQANPECFMVPLQFIIAVQNA